MSENGLNELRNNVADMHPAKDKFNERHAEISELRKILSERSAK